MAENKEFAAFCDRFGEAAGVQVMERIADALWNREGEGISFLDIHQHNACNHTVSGTIEHAGESFGFIIESGDIHGTVIHEWGEPEDVGVFKPAPPTLYTFVPTDPGLELRRPEMWKVYLAWRETPWFKEKERGYNYDRHFQPGSVTEKHYRDWAATKGLMPAIVEEAK